MQVEPEELGPESWILAYLRCLGPASILDGKIFDRSSLITTRKLWVRLQEHLNLIEVVQPRQPAKVLLTAFLTDTRISAGVGDHPCFLTFCNYDPY